MADPKPTTTQTTLGPITSALTEDEAYELAQRVRAGQQGLRIPSAVTTDMAERYRRGEREGLPPLVPGQAYQEIQARRAEIMSPRALALEEEPAAKPAPAPAAAPAPEAKPEVVELGAPPPAEPKAPKKPEDIQFGPAKGATSETPAAKPPSRALLPEAEREAKPPPAKETATRGRGLVTGAVQAFTGGAAGGAADALLSEVYDYVPAIASAAWPVVREVAGLMPGVGQAAAAGVKVFKQMEKEEKADQSRREALVQYEQTGEFPDTPQGKLMRRMASESQGVLPLVHDRFGKPLVDVSKFRTRIAVAKQSQGYSATEARKLADEAVSAHMLSMDEYGFPYFITEDVEEIAKDIKQGKAANVAGAIGKTMDMVATAVGPLDVAGALAGAGPTAREDLARGLAQATVAGFYPASSLVTRGGKTKQELSIRSGLDAFGQVWDSPGNYLAARYLSTGQFGGELTENDIQFIMHGGSMIETLPDQTMFWMRQGFSPKASKVLGIAGLTAWIFGAPDPATASLAVAGGAARLGVRGVAAAVKSTARTERVLEALATGTGEVQNVTDALRAIEKSGYAGPATAQAVARELGAAIAVHPDVGMNAQRAVDASRTAAGALPKAQAEYDTAAAALNAAMADLRKSVGVERAVGAEGAEMADAAEHLGRYVEDAASKVGGRAPTAEASRQAVKRSAALQAEVKGIENELAQLQADAAALRTLSPDKALEEFDKSTAVMQGYARRVKALQTKVDDLGDFGDVEPAVREADALRVELVQAREAAKAADAPVSTAASADELRTATARWAAANERVKAAAQLIAPEVKLTEREIRIKGRQLAKARDELARVMRELGAAAQEHAKKFGGTAADALRARLKNAKRIPKLEAAIRGLRPYEQLLAAQEEAQQAWAALRTIEVAYAQAGRNSAKGERVLAREAKKLITAEAKRTRLAVQADMSRQISRRFREITGLFAASFKANRAFKARWARLQALGRGGEALLTGRGDVPGLIRLREILDKRYTPEIIEAFLKSDSPEARVLAEALDQVGTKQTLSSQYLGQIRDALRTLENFSGPELRWQMGATRAADVERELLEPGMPRGGLFNKVFGRRLRTILRAADPQRSRFGAYRDSVAAAARATDDLLQSARMDAINLLQGRDPGEAWEALTKFLTTNEPVDFIGLGGGARGMTRTNRVLPYTILRTAVEELQTAQPGDVLFDSLRNLFFPYGGTVPDEVTMKGSTAATQRAIAKAGADLENGVPEDTILRTFLENLKGAWGAYGRKETRLDRARAIYTQALTAAALQRRLTDNIRQAVGGVVTPEETRALLRAFGSPGGAGVDAVARDTTLVDMGAFWRAIDKFGHTAGVETGSLGRVENIGKEMLVRATSSGPACVIPQGLTKDFEQSIGKIVKELEPYHNKAETSWVTRAFEKWLYATKVGMTIASPKFWVNQIWGNVGTVMWEEGALYAGKAAFMHLPANWPLVGRFTQMGWVKALSNADPRLRGDGLGTMLNGLLNPHINGMMTGKRYVINGSAGRFWSDDVLRYAEEDGVFQTVVYEEMLSHVQELGRPNWWSRFWREIAEHQEAVQQRQRLALYSECLCNRGYTRKEASEAVKNSYYDWKHGFFQGETGVLLRFNVPFYRFYKLMHRQMARVVLEPFITPTPEMAARALSLFPDAKLSRGRQIAQLVRAAPYAYALDPEALQEDMDSVDLLHDLSPLHEQSWAKATLALGESMDDAYKERIMYARPGQLNARSPYRWENDAHLTRVITSITNVDQMNLIAIMGLMGVGAAMSLSGEPVADTKDYWSRITSVYGSMLNEQTMLAAELTDEQSASGRKMVITNGAKYWFTKNILGLGGYLPPDTALGSLGETGISEDGRPMISRRAELLYAAISGANTLAGFAAAGTDNPYLRQSFLRSAGFAVERILAPAGRKYPGSVTGESERYGRGVSRRMEETAKSEEARAREASRR